jgi:D-arginine dehydrogenase
MRDLPRRTRYAIVGAGFAGGATAWALGRAGLGPGVVVEQESIYGFHASGRNAALLRLAEEDPLVRTLALRSHHHLRTLTADSGPVLEARGGLTLAGLQASARLGEHHELFGEGGLETRLWSPTEARARWPLLEAVEFDTALFCPTEAVIDIHGLLTTYLRQAGNAGFTLHTNCRVDGLLTECGRVAGLETTRGPVRADLVVDASGAWAGHLGRTAQPLPLAPFRRHLFVTGPPSGGQGLCSFTWHEDGGFYFRPEGDGLLMSPCDETPMPAGDPPTDPAALDLLAEKLSRWAPALTGLPIRRSWACLRTFAPDRRPLIGPDPALAGLFHVSGLGGFGAGTSAAVGELAATILAGRVPDWIDASAVAPGRLV